MHPEQYLRTNTLQTTLSELGLYYFGPLEKDYTSFKSGLSLRLFTQTFGTPLFHRKKFSANSRLMPQDYHLSRDEREYCYHAEGGFVESFVSRGIHFEVQNIYEIKYDNYTKAIQRFEPYTQGQVVVGFKDVTIPSGLVVNREANSDSGNQVYSAYLVTPKIIGGYGDNNLVFQLAHWKLKPRHNVNGIHTYVRPVRCTLDDMTDYSQSTGHVLLGQKFLHDFYTAGQQYIQVP